MNYLKKEIIRNIDGILNTNIEQYYIIGSFFKENWVKSKSDIDIVCIDSSFNNYQYSENLMYIENILSILPYKFDIFLYTWDQFNQKILTNLQFKKEINKAIANGKL